MKGRRGKYPPFNPFIVLSDVTISTLVVMTCLLMFYMVADSDTDARVKNAEDYAHKAQQEAQNARHDAEKARQDAEKAKQDAEAAKGEARRAEALLEDRKQKRLSAIEDYQKELGKALQGLTQELNGQGVRDFGVSGATGDSTFLVRFFDNRMFDREKHGTLSPRGRKALVLWSRRFSGLLGQQAGKSKLIEIQVRGHCSPSLARSPQQGWDVSLDRARAAATIIARETGGNVPGCLLSVTGMAQYRPAYKSTAELIDTAAQEDPALSARFQDPQYKLSAREQAYEKLKRNRTPKARLEDRVDILLLYSGGQNQNNYVQAVDPSTHAKYGPLNDTSTPELGPFPFTEESRWDGAGVSEGN